MLTGGIGLAAIRVALAYGLEVFTTVSNPEKKKFVMDCYPQLKGILLGDGPHIVVLNLKFISRLQNATLGTLETVHLRR